METVTETSQHMRLAGLFFFLLATYTLRLRTFGYIGQRDGAQTWLRCDMTVCVRLVMTKNVSVSNVYANLCQKYGVYIQKPMFIERNPNTIKSIDRKNPIAECTL